MKTYKKINRRGIHTALTALSLMATQLVWAEALNTQLPRQQEEVFGVPVNVDIPAQPLANSLHDLGKATGMNISFPNDVVSGKTAPEVRGRMTRKEALQRVLSESGLEPKVEGNNIFIQKPPKQDKKDIQLDKVEVRAKRSYDIGPLRGLALTKEEIPGNVQSITAKEIKESKAVSLTDLMNSKLQSVNVNDYQSNPFQMDVTYRGFTASPQLGTSQGLSVFLDGIRVNEPFGDVVNWDMIPMNALNSLDVFPGSNPLFGLGTLGGAISMKTKSGFDSSEGSVEYLGGSFKRNQFQGSVGGNNGVIAGFAAANIFREDGWRVNSPSEVNQIFGKAEWRNDSVQLGLSMLYAGNKLIGNGLLPTEMAKQDGSQIFTSPDETKNRLLQFQLNGIWDVSDTFNITGQVYRRKSRRNASNGDVNQNFGGSATRRPVAGEQLANGSPDFNGDGLPDIEPANGVAIENVAATSVPDGSGGFIKAMLDINGEPEYFGVDSNGNVLLNSAFSAYDASSPSGYDLSKLAIGSNVASTAVTGQSVDSNGSPLWTLNPQNLTTAPAFSPEFYQYALKVWAGRGLADDGRGSLPGQFFNPDDLTYQYKDANGFLVAGSSYSIDARDPVTGASLIRLFSGSNPGLGKPLGLLVTDAVGIPIDRNGADCSYTPADPRNGKCAGYIEGTPTALITQTEIDQTTDGASLQLNWNLENHKFMMGASIDAADATYESGQYVGLFDSKRRAYLDPSQVGYEFYASDHRIDLNNFAGNSTTKSVYFSETWTPKKEWAFTAAGRFNYTNIKNELATNNILGLLGPTAFKNFYQNTVVCPDSNGNGTLELEECPAGTLLPFSPERALGQGVLGKGEIEKFTYRSFNPSLGATWQPTESLNLYGNWNRGARTPSVIELGCAFDDTPVYDKDPVTGELIFVGPRSLAERRFCSLPSTLSGDPYLKQVRSETVEFGGRGYLTPTIQWNATAYQTDLTDDIYFVSFTADRSFFQNIGDTRRRGIELGLQGRADNWGFRVNYSLTDATFQERFMMASPNNSSAGNVSGRGNGYEQITVSPGNRIPGVPLHNLNATVSYDITPDWTVSLTGILHSESFVRGNENNKHQEGAANSRYLSCTAPTVIDGIQYGNDTCATKIDSPNFRYPGKVPGYAVWNLKTSYKLTKNLTAGLMVNNLFDREYYSAGRLGINPFSPSINGAIGPGGFNYNSNDWLASTFLAPGAPRSAFFTLTYDFDVGK